MSAVNEAHLLQPSRTSELSSSLIKVYIQHVSRHLTHDVLQWGGIRDFGLALDDHQLFQSVDMHHLIVLHPYQPLECVDQSVYNSICIVTFWSALSLKMYHELSLIIYHELSGNNHDLPCHLMQNAYILKIDHELSGKAYMYIYIYIYIHICIYV